MPNIKQEAVNMEESASNKLTSNIMRMGILNNQENNLSKKMKKIPLKTRAFRVINLLQQFNPIQKTFYLVLLSFEFMQFLAFLLFYVKLSHSCSSSVNSSVDDKEDGFQLGHIVNFITLKSLLNDYIDAKASYAFLSLALLVVTLHLMILRLLSLYAKDGQKALSIRPWIKLLLKTASVTQVLLTKLCFIPILVILFSHLICQKSTGENSISYSNTGSDANSKVNTTITVSSSSQSQQNNLYYDYECWTASHITLSIVCVGFAVLLIALTALMSLLLNDPRANSKLPWANALSRAELIKTLMKVLIAIALQLDFYNKWIFFVLYVTNVLLAYILIHQRFKYFYHSDRKILVATFIQEAFYLSLSIIMTIMIAILETISYYAFVYIILSSLAFTLLLLVLALGKDHPTSFLEFINIRQEHQYESFYLRLQKYLGSTNHKTIDKTIMFSLIKYHQKTCSNNECTCEQLFYLLSANRLDHHLDQTTDMIILQDQYFSGNEAQDQQKHSIIQLKSYKSETDAKHIKIFESKFQKILFKLFHSMLQQTIDKFPRSIRLKFIQVEILQKELNNEFKSYFQIMKMLKENPPLEWQFQLYSSKQTVEQIMYKKYQQLLNNKQGIDVIKVYNFEQQFIQFEKQIVNTANNCLNFWKELMDKRLDVNRIHDFGVQISNSFQEVSELANQMTKLFPSHLMFLKIYALFLQDVMNNENEAAEIHAKVKSQLQNQDNQQNLQLNEEKFFGFNTKTVIITMTVTPKDIGNIVNANFETQNLLGYKHKEIKGKNVRILMPKILSDNHDAFIQNYFETAKAKILERHRIIIGKTQEGYIVPLYILVKAIPNLKRNLTFVGFLRKLDEHNAFTQPPSQFAGQDYHIIVADDEGQIHGFTKNCWETFGFKPTFFFNKFGDPEQCIRINKIIRNLRDPNFLVKLEKKRDGCFCSLDTGLVMENVSNELLNRDEQEQLITISGSYNINLQIEEMIFADGKIVLKIYKILKVSRIIRSQNVLDMIQTKVDEINDLSFDASEDSSEIHGTQSNTNLNIPRQDSLEMVDHAISQSLNSDYSKGSVHHNHDTASVNDNYQTSKYLKNFKKQISTKEMPASIIKLNRLVIFLVLLILLISILDIVQSINFYKFTQDHQGTLQQLYEKHYLIAKINNNILSLALINLGLQRNQYLNFTIRNQDINGKLLKDIDKLEQIERSIQDKSYSRLLIFQMKEFDQNPYLKLKSLNQDASVIEEDQPMRYIISQMISKVQELIYQNISQVNVSKEVYTFMPYSNQRSQYQKNLYFVVENTLDTLADFNSQQNELFYESFKGVIQTNKIVLYAGYVFFAIFVFLSGAIVFPIVIGVQKNKVMILSIYFELPHQEIERVFFKCLQFMIKIDAKLNDSSNEMVEQAHQAKLLLKMQLEKLQQNQQDGSEQDLDDLQSERDPPNQSSNQPPQSMRGDSSRSSSRELMHEDIRLSMIRDKHRGQIGRKSILANGISNPNQPLTLFERIRNKKMSSEYLQREIIRKTTVRQSKIMIAGANGSLQRNYEDREADIVGSATPNAQEKGQQDNPHIEDTINTRILDKSKMFKDIKVKNNKINFITLSVMLIFLVYFSCSFGVNMAYLGDISEGLKFQKELYSKQPNLEYAALYFIQDIMRNTTYTRSQPTSSSSPASDNYNDQDLNTYFQYFLSEIYIEQDQQEEVKKQNRGILQATAANFLQRIDNSSFCEVISKYLDSDFERNQCQSFNNGYFIYGVRSSIFSILYELQQLRVRFDSSRSSQQALKSLLNEDAFLKYSVLSNVYYQATFKSLCASITDSIEAYYNKIILFAELRFAFFVLFLFLIFTVLWRIFLKSIQAEVFRSKGMLNMIPTQFLERDNNLKKLSLNKLINLS